MTKDPSSRVVYIRLRRHVRLRQGTVVRLGDIARLLAPPELEKVLQDTILDMPQENDGNRMVIDMLQVIGKIKEHDPDLVVEYIGEPHTLVEIIEKERRPSIIAFIIVWMLLFFGSMLTIMNFHADVSMPEVMVRIVEMISGKKDLHPYLFQGAYSIGIGLGMIVFFNHLFRKKWNEEPTPLEVEMFLYQENVDHFVITEEYKKLHQKNSQLENSK